MDTVQEFSRHYDAMVASIFTKVQPSKSRSMSAALNEALYYHRVARCFIEYHEYQEGLRHGTVSQDVSPPRKPFVAEGGSFLGAMTYYNQAAVFSRTYCYQVWFINGLEGRVPRDQRLNKRMAGARMWAAAYIATEWKFGHMPVPSLDEVVDVLVKRETTFHEWRRLRDMELDRLRRVERDGAGIPEAS